MPGSQLFKQSHSTHAETIAEYLADFSTKL